MSSSGDSYTRLLLFVACGCLWMGRSPEAWCCCCCWCRDSEVYAEYRLNVTRAGIASEFEKKRRTLVVGAQTNNTHLCLPVCVCVVCWPPTCPS